MNSSMKVEDGFKKRIGKYLISFCQTQYYGKSLHGQMRAGYEQPNNKLFIFRINPLPLSNTMRSFFNLQKLYSDLKDFSRIVHEDVSSSSSNYTVLEFFPKTFESEIENFRKNQKYFDEMVEKFLKTYSFFYNMRVSHGNLLPSNIGITFDSKVKLMDFQILPQNATQDTFQQDLQSFKLFISRVLEKDSNYPYKFDTFNKKQNERWDHLFSSWHVTSPLEPVYIERNNWVENVVTGLYKLENSLEEICERLQDGEEEDEESGLKYQSENREESGDGQEQDQKEDGQKSWSEGNPDKQLTMILSPTQKLLDLRMSLRLLQLHYLTRHQSPTTPKLLQQQQTLQQIIGSLQNHDLDYYNSVIIGAIRDFQYYHIDASRRLFLVSCLVPNLNHEYIFNQIVQEFKEDSIGENKERNLLLGDCLFSQFRKVVLGNLLKRPKGKTIF